MNTYKHYINYKPYYIGESGFYYTYYNHQGCQYKKYAKNIKSTTKYNSLFVFASLGVDFFTLALLRFILSLKVQEKL